MSGSTIARRGDAAWALCLSAVWGVATALQIEAAVPPSAGLLLLPGLAAGLLVAGPVAAALVRHTRDLRPVVLLLLASCAAAQATRIDVRVGVVASVVVLLAGAALVVYARRARPR